MNKNPAFFVDTSICIGCKGCMIACKDKNNVPIGINYRRVIESVKGGWVHHADGTFTQDVGACYISISCNHCEKSPCIAACPTGAMHRDENGIVRILEDRCVGCNNCRWNCPYSAPQFDKAAKHMKKCDFCYDYLAEGKNPACVDACPARAIQFGPREELIKKHGRANIAPLPLPTVTEPNLAIKMSHNAVPSGGPAVLANREEI